ncbi:MAG: hypothetical protein M3Q09_07760, partial [Gemmatimonadota bacterium]|nr:hypothetical protein [Gemmatimonadota bacterium]
MPRTSRLSLFFVGAVALFATPTGSALAQYSLFGWKLSEFQPNIPNGGRANTITVNPANNDQIIVASETGGLFKSTNRGVTWEHLNGLPEFSTSAVAYVPADPNVVIVTTTEDTRVNNGGGIWRSTNGGFSWTQLPGPPVPPGIPARLSAFEISMAPDNGKIYVGTEYGVSISNDRGLTWTHVTPFGLGGRVISVLAQSGNRVLAASAAGIMRSGDGGTTWLPSTSGTGGANISDLHALGASPFSNTTAYVVNWSTNVYVTEDGGDNWTRITSAPGGGGACGGIAFVKATGIRIIGRPPRRTTRRITLYAGNRCGMSRLVAPQIPGTGRFDYSGAWTTINMDHGDTRDLAFTSLRQPLLLGTDGGLHRTADGGLNWTFAGGGTSGYNALQITEIKGQTITSLGRHDLYFGTQDNNLWASGDGGTTWPGAVCCEGFFIEQQRRVVAPADSKTTFVACGGCADWLTNPLFAALAAWPDATTPPAANPVIVGRSFHIQGVDSTAVFRSGFASTNNLGASWRQYVTFPEGRRDIPKVSTSPLRTAIYQSIRTGFDAARNFEIDQFARITTSLFSTTPSVRYPLMNNFGGLGINPTMFAWYQVFGVDPENTRHVIAPDIVNEKMMETWDGGDNWTEIPNLTAQVTDSGRLLFRRSIFPQASAVSFASFDPNLVAVGTWQGGLFISGNRGATWEKVPGSEAVTYITSIHWTAAHSAIVSSYGRGLWRIIYGLLRPLPEFDRYCRAPSIFDPYPLREPIERYRRAILVFDGNIRGARVVNGVLRQLFVSPGSSVVFFSDSRMPGEIEITETRRLVGFTGARAPRT